MIPPYKYHQDESFFKLCRNKCGPHGFVWELGPGPTASSFSDTPIILAKISHDIPIKSIIYPPYGDHIHHIPGFSPKTNRRSSPGVLSQVLLQAADGEILPTLGRRRHRAAGRLVEFAQQNCHQKCWKSLEITTNGWHRSKDLEKNAKNRRFNQQKFGVRILTNIGWRVNVRKTPQMCGRQPASAVKCPSVHWPSQCHISGELPSWKYTYQPLPKPQGDLGIKSSIKFTGLAPVPWEETSKPQKLGSNLPQASIFGVGWRNFLKFSKSHSIRRAPDSSAPPLASKYVGNWSRCCATTQCEGRRRPWDGWDTSKGGCPSESPWLRRWWWKFVFGASCNIVQQNCG